MCYLWQVIRQGVRWSPKEFKHLAVKDINLKAVKSIKLSFDPFVKSNISVRELWFSLLTGRVKDTNPKCKIVADVRNDRKPPIFSADLHDGRQLLFETEHMNLLEILKILKKYTAVEKEPDKS